MLRRDLFVTNSSSTCHIIYGIRFQLGEVDKLIKLLLDTHGEAMLDELDDIYGFDESGDPIMYDPDNAESTSHVISLIKELAEDDWTSFIDDFLPSGIQFRLNNEYECAYLDFTEDLTPAIYDDHIILKNISAKAYQEMVDLAEGSGVENTRPGLYYWVEYDG